MEINGCIGSVRGRFFVGRRGGLDSVSLLVRGSKADAEKAVREAAEALGVGTDRFLVAGTIEGLGYRCGFDKDGRLSTAWITKRDSTMASDAYSNARGVASKLGIDTVYLTGSFPGRSGTLILNAHGSPLGCLFRDRTYQSVYSMWRDAQQSSSVLHRARFQNCHILTKDKKLYEAGMVADHADRVWPVVYGKDATSIQKLLTQIKALPTAFGTNVRFACKVKGTSGRLIDGLFVSPDGIRFAGATVYGDTYRSTDEIKAELDALASDLHLPQESIWLDASLRISADDMLEGTFLVDRDRFTNAKRFRAYIKRINNRHPDYTTMRGAASSLVALSKATGIDVEAIGVLASIGYRRRSSGEEVLIEMKKQPTTNALIPKATLRRRDCYSSIDDVVERQRQVAKRWRLNACDVTVRCRFRGDPGTLTMDQGGRVTFSVPVETLEDASAIAAKVRRVAQLRRMEPTDVFMRGRLQTSDKRTVAGVFGLDRDGHVTFRGIGGAFSTREQVIERIKAFAAATGLDAGNIELTGTFPLAGGTRVRCIFSLAPGDGAGGPSVAIRLAGGIR